MTLTAVALVTTSCAAGGGAGTDGAPVTAPGFTGTVPEFSGPYASEFADLYTRASSDFARDVLADGQITDAEFAEMTSRFASCLDDQGITFHGFQPDGSLSTSVAPGGADTHSIVSECSGSSGEDVINALASIMRVNPENVAWASLMVDCLVGRGVVPQGYTVEQYEQDDASRFADFENLPVELQEALTSCSSDPQGLLE